MFIVQTFTISSSHAEWTHFLLVLSPTAVQVYLIHGKSTIMEQQIMPERSSLLDEHIEA